MRGIRGPRAPRRPARAARRRRSSRVVVAIAIAGGGVYAVASDDPAGVSAPDVVGRKRRGRARRGHDSVPATTSCRCRRSRSSTAPTPSRRRPARSSPRIRRRGSGSRRTARCSSRSARAARTPTFRPSPGSREPPRSRCSSGKGFTPTRRYAPSTEIEAWHAVETDPRAGHEAQAAGPRSRSSYRPARRSAPFPLLERPGRGRRRARAPRRRLLARRRRASRRRASSRARSSA